MNQHLQSILNLIQQSDSLTAEQKNAISKSLKDADKELEITAFKLDRTEKVKRTTAILLEETIEELEQKRKAVEGQNRELEIESALERVRTAAMAMKIPAEMLSVCRMISDQLLQLGFKEIRNVQTVIIYPQKHEYLNYQYFTPYDKDSIEIIDYRLHPDVLEFTNQMLASTDAYYTKTFEGEELKVWREYRKQTNQLPDPKLDATTSSHYYFYSIGSGALGVTTYAPLSEEQIDLFKRFRNVFDLAYRRFLDIEKAEAQSREAQIELSLERVRARTMAMQRSDELAEAASLLFKQINDLGIQTWTSGFNIWEKNDTSFIGYNPTPSGDIAAPYHIPSTEDSFFINIYEAKKRGEDLFVFESEGKSLAETYSYMKTLPVVKEVLKGIENSGFQLPTFQINHCVFFSHGFLLFITLEAFPEAHDIFKRFGKVFEQTYTRFLDLQKAEAQAREAQIEAALERVRSRTMGMQKSEELKEIIQVVYEQFVHLNILIEHTGFIMDYKARDDMNIWLADKHEVPSEVTIPYFDCAHWNSFNEAKEKGIDFFANHLAFEEKNRFYQDLFKLIPGVPDETKEYYFSCPGVAISTVLLENVGLYIENFSAIPYTDEENNTLMRFGKVFQQTYTRFLDLQKAEAQAREAQIEVSLERVRSRAMAMHNSADLNSVVATVFEELGRLKLGVLRCGIGIFNKEKRTGDVWSTSLSSQGTVLQVSGDESFDIHPLLQGTFNAWLEQKDFYYELEGKDFNDYYKALTKTNFRLTGQQSTTLENKNLKQYYYTPMFQAGNLYAFSETPFSEDAKKIMKRFAGVLNLTYNRFLDLQKAEAQAREANIEAALERVRAQTMAMNKSQDLQHVVSVIFRELDKLELKTLRCGIGIINADHRSVDVWTTTTTSDGYEINFSGNESMDVHPMLQGVFAAWERQEEDFYYVLQGEDLISYYNTMKGDSYTLPDGAAGAMVSDKDSHYYYCSIFSSGGLYLFREIPFTEEIIKVIRRFANAFSLAYKRFEDLKQSEARALEAIKESSLDRLRAEIASMRTTDDLQRITPIIWQELTMLEVPFFRCGVFIIDEINTEIKIYLSAPDGHFLGVMNVPFNANSVTINSVDHWRKGLVYTEHWDKEAFVNWMQTIIKQGQFKSAEAYQGTADPPESLDMHFVPFSQGMLYVGNSSPLAKEKIDLVKSLAETFSIAYARYEDFNKLESAKEQIEKTLVDLKQAQSQLIQSEKMASLGELTAGIAHEIQNPLNFVNNFSEVSSELLDEMIIELGNDNKADAIAIADDVKQNLEKILHHGKQADGIVKGMLQHSRSSSATKEPTDINKLADEYLRLAFHGLRAKDKSFNATLKTDYDETIGTINVIPQDIGRVILNLITNAFYAVTEKKKQQPEGYQPTVSVNTKKTGDKVQIKVADNGNGIPPKVLDKIFQPFFTTKPTGQGTGLGLSLSYDIVKAHGGELKVETKEGQWAEFIIQLPVA